MNMRQRYALGTSGVLALVGLAVTAGHANAQSAAAVTFSKDVAPIFQAKCQDCHRPGSMAPMSLITYEEARPWARAIRERGRQYGFGACQR